MVRARAGAKVRVRVGVGVQIGVRARVRVGAKSHQTRVLSSRCRDSTATSIDGENQPVVMAGA